MINCKKVISRRTWLWNTGRGYGAVPLRLQICAEAVAPDHELPEVEVPLGDEPVHRGSGPVVLGAAGVVAQDDVPDLVVAEDVAQLRCQVTVPLNLIRDSTSEIH